jgi:nucleoside phosphorylase
MRTLFLSASLRPQSALALALEFNQVRATLEHVNISWARGLDHWPNVRIDQFAAQLLDHAPDIVHFAGHASPDGELEFLGPVGEALAIRAEVIARLFAEVSGAVKLVVLNTCYSIEIGELLRPYVDVIVGVSGTDRIDDEVAVGFAATFYRYLAQPGSSLARAFGAAQALLEARFAGAGDRLHMHVRDGIDPSVYCLARDVEFDERRADLLIHVPTAVDREVLLEHFDGMAREFVADYVDDARRGECTYSYVAANRSKPMKIVVIEPARTGQLWTAATLGAAIDAWRPHNVVVVGLAGAYKAANVSVGDVVLVDKIIYYEPEDVLGVPLGRADHFYTDSRLLRLAQRGISRLRDAASFQVGTVMSGEKHDGPKYVPPAAILVDTEAAAAAVASEVSAARWRPALLVVRGVGSVIGETSVAGDHRRRAYQHQACAVGQLIRELGRANDPLRPLPSYKSRLRFSTRTGATTGWTVELQNDGLGAVCLEGQGPQTVDLRWNSRLTINPHGRGWEIAIMAQADSPLLDTVVHVELDEGRLELPLLAPGDRKLGDASGYRELGRFVTAGPA